MSLPRDISPRLERLLAEEKLRAALAFAEPRTLRTPVTPETASRLWTAALRDTQNGETIGQAFCRLLRVTEADALLALHQKYAARAAPTSPSEQKRHCPVCAGERFVRDLSDLRVPCPECNPGGAPP